MRGAHGASRRGPEVGCFRGRLLGLGLVFPLGAPEGESVMQVPCSSTCLQPFPDRCVRAWRDQPRAPGGALSPSQSPRAGTDFP